MLELIVNQRYIIPWVLTFLGFIIVIYFRKKFFVGDQRKILWLALIVFFLTVLLMIGGAIYLDVYYQWDLNRYDLNGDGNFADDLRTPEQEKAYEEAQYRFVADSARTFSIITGPILGLVMFILTYLVGLIVLFLRYIIRKLSSKH